jgi:hypothetical protein
VGDEKKALLPKKYVPCAVEPAATENNPPAAEDDIEKGAPVSNILSIDVANGAKGKEWDMRSMFFLGKLTKFAKYASTQGKHAEESRQLIKCWTQLSQVSVLHFHTPEEATARIAGLRRASI